MNTVWILVCDSARARLFETRDNERPWTLLEVLGHAESRSKARELVSDHLGQRSSQGASVHHNALAPASSPKDTEKAHFGHMLAAMLDQGLRSQRFDQWLLVSPPHFLGMLRNLLTPELQKHLSASVAKDLTHIDAADLRARLQDIFDNLPEEPIGVRSARKHAN